MKQVWSVILVMTGMLALNSCVLQTSPALASSALSGPSPEVLEEVSFHRAGDLYYVGFRTRYQCKPEPVRVALPLAHGTPGITICEIDETVGEEEEFYVLLTVEQAKACLGVAMPEPPAGVPSLIRGKDWDATLAHRYPVRTEGRVHQLRIGVDARLASDEARCAFDAGNMEVYLPLRVGWDAAYKFPMSLGLFLCVDVPGTMVLSVAGVIGGVVYSLGEKPIAFFTNAIADEARDASVAPPPVPETTENQTN